MQGIPGLVELLASQEGLCSLELLGWFVVCLFVCLFVCLVGWLVG